MASNTSTHLQIIQRVFGATLHWSVVRRRQVIECSRTDVRPNPRVHPLGGARVHSDDVVRSSGSGKGKIDTQVIHGETHGDGGGEQWIQRLGNDHDEILHP